MGMVLVLFFFQITDQIFTDKCECVTKFKEMVINEEDTALVQYYLFFIQLQESYFLPWPGVWSYISNKEVIYSAVPDYRINYWDVFVKSYKNNCSIYSLSIIIEV